VSFHKDYYSKNVIIAATNGKNELAHSLPSTAYYVV
jgi:hypothetical protein